MKPTIKAVKEWIDYYIEKNKEWLEEEFDINFLMIDYKKPFCELFPEENLEYCIEFNIMLLEEMNKRGYKAHWATEDIEFWKEK